MRRLYFIFFIWFSRFKNTVQASDLNTVNENRTRWCVINDNEENKCIKLQQALHDIKPITQISCVKGKDRDDCTEKIENRNADLMTLDAGEVYVAGRYHSIIPIMFESNNIGENKNLFYFSVAVVRKKLPLRNIYDLQKKRLCSPGIMQMAGWIAPIANLLKTQTMHIADCNNNIKSAAYFFGPSCVPGSLDAIHNPIGDNPSTLCDMCIDASINKFWCTDNDPYAGYAGALQCIADNRGDIAFVKHTSILEKLQTPGTNFREQDYDLLCMDGRRQPLSMAGSAPQNCHWGKVPVPVVVTVSSTSHEDRKTYQKLLMQMSDVFGARNQNNFNFKLFESLPYGGSNLMFLDSSQVIIPIEDQQQTFEKFLEKDYLDYIKVLHQCSIDYVRLCVTSAPELVKCNNIQLLFSAQVLQPKLICVHADSHKECMKFVQNNKADIFMADSGDVFRAGKYYNLIPIMVEIYDQEEPISYAVAVAKKIDKETNLLELKGKRSCHGGVGFSAGWNNPITFMFNHARMRNSGCKNVAKAVSEYFEKSCSPGLLSSEYNHKDDSLSNMCDLCIGIGQNYCSRDHTEPYFGSTGSFRCMVEGGGDVAFLKHTTVLENTDGRKSDFWARNLISDDYELLCRDGTRRNVKQYEECNLGTVPSNAMMTSEHKNFTIISAITNLFFYGQRHLGAKLSEDFQIFGSTDGYSDLIFQDSTTQLRVIAPERQTYYDHLGYDYLKLIEKIDCFGGSSQIAFSIFLLFIALATSFLL